MARHPLHECDLQVLLFACTICWMAVAYSTLHHGLFQVLQGRPNASMLAGRVVRSVEKRIHRGGPIGLAKKIIALRSGHVAGYRVRGFGTSLKVVHVGDRSTYVLGICKRSRMRLIWPRGPIERLSNFGRIGHIEGGGYIRLHARGGVAFAHTWDAL